MQLHLAPLVRFLPPSVFFKWKALTSLLILLLKYKSEKEYFFQLSESIRLDKLWNCYLAIILSLVHGKNHLRRHPVRRPNKTVGRTRDTGRAEVGQLDVTRICYQNIASFYVPKIVNSWLKNGEDILSFLPLSFVLRQFLFSIRREIARNPRWIKKVSNTTQRWVNGCMRIN